MRRVVAALLLLAAAAAPCCYGQADSPNGTITVTVIDAVPLAQLTDMFIGEFNNPPRIPLLRRQTPTRL